MANGDAFTNITIDEMDDLLRPHGMEQIRLDGVKEVVYGKLIEDGDDLYQLRVFTGIEGTESRGCGKDAIKTILVKRDGDEEHIVGSGKKVYRMDDWQKHLTKRVTTEVKDMLPRKCKSCGKHMKRVTIKARGLDFFGCSDYPNCRYTEEVDGSAGEGPKKSDKPAPEVCEDVKCPKCQKGMVKRSGRYGDFYGCSQFPACRGTRKLNEVAQTANA